MKHSCPFLRPGSLLGALVLATASWIQPAAAASNSYCGGGGSPGLSLADMSFNGLQASDCYGVVLGNDKPSAINSLAWGNDWTLLGKDEGSSSTFTGVQFDLDTSGATSGSWSLLASDLSGTSPLNLPMTLDVVAVLKASNRYAAYYFEGAVLDGTDGGTWSIAFRNHGGQIPDLSHLSFYVRIPSAVPEADTYAMMLAGLALVGFMARRGARIQRRR